MKKTNITQEKHKAMCAKLVTIWAANCF